jgi:hypothetical protein
VHDADAVLEHERIRRVLSVRMALLDAEDAALLQLDLLERALAPKTSP